MPWSRFLNVETLREITEGDRELEQKFIDMFMRNFGDCLARLEPLVDYDSEKLWSKIVHELKGSSANIRAETLSEICSEAEPLTDSVQKREVFERMRAEYQRYQAALKAALQ